MNFKEWFKEKIYRDVPKFKFVIDYWSLQIVEVPFKDVYYDSKEEAEAALEVLKEELSKRQAQQDLLNNPKNIDIKDILAIEKELRELKRKFCNEKWGGCVKQSKEKKQQLLHEWYNEQVNGGNKESL